jgi:hypothetical protein
MPPEFETGEETIALKSSIGEKERAFDKAHACHQLHHFAQLIHVLISPPAYSQANWKRVAPAVANAVLHVGYLLRVDDQMAVNLCKCTRATCIVHRQEDDCRH